MIAAGGSCQAARTEVNRGSGYNVYRATTSGGD